jgi:hypothetical protein
MEITIPPFRFPFLVYPKNTYVYPHNVFCISGAVHHVPDQTCPAQRRRQRSHVPRPCGHRAKKRQHGVPPRHRAQEDHLRKVSGNDQKRKGRKRRDHVNLRKIASNL